MAWRCSRATPHHLDSAVLPAGMLIGLTFSLLLGGFLLLGRHPASVMFVALGTLTGSYAADRLARGWYYLGGQNGIPSIPPMTIGSYEISEGPVYYYLALGISLVVYRACAGSCALAIRPGSGRASRERTAHSLFRLQGTAPQGERIRARRHDRGTCRQPLRVPRRHSSGPTCSGVVIRPRSCCTCCSAGPAR